jgi:chromosome segregation ATPase
MTGTAKDAAEHVDHPMRAETGPIAALGVRIRAAFGEAATSVDIANLITEAERAAITSAEAAERARLQALDPALSAADVAAARRAMEDACFERDRMHEAVRRLGERLRVVKSQEEQARRRAAYDAALVERDKLAVEVAEVYPPLAEKLADLAARVAANDAVIERVNRKLPDRAKWIDSAELVARKLRNFNDRHSEGHEALAAAGVPVCRARPVLVAQPENSAPLRLTRMAWLAPFPSVALP